MAVDKKQLMTLLENAFPGAFIELNDYAGDQNHYELVIKHHSLVGLSKVHQHRMIYEKIGAIVGNELHALSIKTLG